MHNNLKNEELSWKKREWKFLSVSKYIVNKKPKPDK